MGKESPGKRRPTMTDVAKLAGVSQSTVSLIVNEKPNITIPDSTRDKVWAAVKQLGFRPNALAQGLRSDRSGIVGFMTDELVTTNFAGLIVKGAQDAAWLQRKILMLVNLDDREGMAEETIEKMLEHRVDGLIFATMYHHAVVLPELIREIPTVLVNCFVEDRSLPSVVPDEVEGGRRATEILIQRGHRRIGFINNTKPIPATFGRVAGYRLALEQHSIPYDDDLVVSLNSGEDGGYQGTQQLLNLPQPPTAIFCYNDRTAMGTYYALIERKLKVPNDVAVMGYDNQEIIAQHLRPSLSTMELPHYQMGQWAIEYLSKNDTGKKNRSPVQHQIVPQFIQRSSI
ncbi:LacI family DNA-binding transcriptional regulator [Paenibacillaceae bacterium WGS1546]|uniref:LacI family DNA-binding transcriptional regulator n=1 Tax=Cohnella sp. WGS1546 TaxID=3366810 RepID=UPI00372D39F5